MLPFLILAETIIIIFLFAFINVFLECLYRYIYILLNTDVSSSSFLSYHIYSLYDMSRV